MSAQSLLTLGSEEAHVWFLVTDGTLTATHRRRGLSLLSPEERVRYDRFAFDRDRLQFLVSHALVRTMLSRYADVPARSWTFRTSTHGRPEIAGPPAHTRLRFNLSHTRDLSALVVAWDRDVGIDVESLDRRPVAHDVASRYFSPVENGQLARMDAAHRHEGFLRIWTLKESYIKACGMGLTLPLREFSFDLRDDRPPAIAFAPARPDDSAAWQFVEVRPTPKHVMAVAIRRTPGRDVVLRVRRTTPP